MSTRVPDNGYGTGFQAIGIGVSQTISFSGTSARNSTAFQASTTLVRVATTADCFIIFGGSSVTASANGSCLFLPSGSVEYFGCSQSNKFLAVIQSSATGTLYITEAL